MKPQAPKDLEAERDQARKERDELKAYKDAVDWCMLDWPDIEFSHESVTVYRLEPTQGEQRVFTGKTFLEAMHKAMSTPPFQGETVPEYMSPNTLENKRLRDELAEARKDTERLDWMASLNEAALWHNLNDEYSFVPNDLPHKSATGKTLRQAIDAAREVSA